MPLRERQGKSSVERVIGDRGYLSCHSLSRKYVSQIGHSRHRSLASLMVSLVCGLIAYCHQPNKLGLHLVLYPPLEDANPN